MHSCNCKRAKKERNELTLPQFAASSVLLGTFCTLGRIRHSTLTLTLLPPFLPSPMKLRMMYRHEETLFRSITTETVRTRTGLRKYFKTRFRDEAIFTYGTQLCSKGNSRNSFDGLCVRNGVGLLFMGVGVSDTETSEGASQIPCVYC